ncbi:MAG TPA: histidine kinase dimerization/phospho-acceptor domain-containing protein [Longimicrobium sp.]|nr:histidine kinase dimerization/phospho-acceptor domain-containing protein [Longimicrobium sp.]
MSEPAAPVEPVRHPLPPELIHELRTPLTQIIGYSELLIEQAVEAGDTGYLADLRKVNAAGYRLLALMEESFQSVRTPAPATDAARGPACIPQPDEGADATR